MTKAPDNASNNIFVVSDWFVTDVVRRDGQFSQLDEADSLHRGSLVYCQNLHYLDLANTNPNVTAIITTPALAEEAIADTKAIIVADDPRMSFFMVYRDFYSKGSVLPQIEPGTGKDCRIHPSAVVSSLAKLGDRVEIGPGVVITDSVRIGDDTSIGPNTVIGADGLITLRREEDGSLLRFKHAGGVSIGKGVEILAGAVVTRSLFMNPTTIGDYCQIGIMANVGHGVSIGERSVISGNTVIAGRTKLGSRVWLGASSSIAQGLVIGEGASIKIGAVVVSNIEPGAVVSGNFAVPHNANMRHFFKLKS